MPHVPRQVKTSPDGYPLTKQGVRDLGKTRSINTAPALPEHNDGAKDYDLAPPFRLMVSEDCGCSYHCVAKRDDPSDFDSLVAKYTDLRWYIEDSKGEFVGLSPIHHKIFAMMATMR